MWGATAAVTKDDRGREGLFYDRLAPQLLCRTPRLLSREPGRIYLERLPTPRPLDAWTPADLLSGARMLALVHGRFWGLSALAEEHTWLPLDALPRSRPVALCHGDFGPGHLHMAEDGTKWVISWGRCHLGDPRSELSAYARRAARVRPRVTVDAIVASYLDVLRDRLDIDVDPSVFRL